MTRLSQHDYFMEIARTVKRRATCVRRQVGCVFVDERKHIIATGYNGIPSGMKHCTKSTCPRMNTPSGESLHTCYAVHAEINALIQCVDTQKIKTAYITNSPCLVCTCALLNTSCTEIIFDSEYNSPGAKELWQKNGRMWTQNLRKKLSNT